MANSKSTAAQMALALLLGSAPIRCSTPPHVAPAIVSYMVGQTFEAFVTRHGIPANKVELPGGRTLYEWSDTFGVERTGSAFQTLAASAGNVQTRDGAYQLVCAIRFTVERNGVISDAAVTRDTYGRHTTSRCAEVFSQ